MTANEEETPQPEMPEVKEVPQFRMPTPEEIAAASSAMQAMGTPQQQTGIPPKLLILIAKVSIGFLLAMALNDVFTAWLVHLM